MVLVRTGANPIIESLASVYTTPFWAIARSPTALIRAERRPGPRAVTVVVARACTRAGDRAHGTLHGRRLHR
jgi:hypothetical protein